jgi:hypothetical protein
MDVLGLISRAGGVVLLAQRLGVSRTTVLGWRKSGVIPGHRLGQIAVEFHIAPGRLIKLVAPKKPRNAA